MAEWCAQVFKKYKYMIDNGVPKEEARQILPNAAAVNMLMTWNARSLLNFFEQRCCNRNVEEMRIFANRLRRALMTKWPKLVVHMGPQCHIKRCKQGHMKCSEEYWRQIGAGAKYDE